MLGSHDDSRYLASSPIAFQLFQNLKSGQIRHHNVDKNCDQLLKKQPIAIFQLSWLPRSQYNKFVFTSFSANTEKLSSSSPIKTFAAESGADEGEFALASGISSSLAADISKEFSSSGAYTIGSLTKKVEPTPGELVISILPPQKFRQLFAHRQSQPGAFDALLQGIFELDKFFKNPSLVGCGNTKARICH